MSLWIEGARVRRCPLSPLRIINDMVKGGTAMTSIASSASEVKVQHRSLLIELGYEEFTGRLEQILSASLA